MIIKALSIRAPWTEAILSHGKPWENRPRAWRSYTGPLLIHASKTCSRADYEAAYERIASLSGIGPTLYCDALRGGLVGAVLLTGCAEPLKRDSGWRVAGQYGLALEHPIALPFRAMRGSLAPFPVELTAEEERLLTPLLEAWEARRAHVR